MNEYLPAWLLALMWASLCGTILAAFAAMATRVFAARIPARWLCALWLLVILRFVPWPAVESRWSLWPRANQHATATVPAAVVSRPIAADFPMPAVTPSAAPFSRGSVVPAAPVTRVSALPAPAAAPHGASPAEKPHWPKVIIVALYLAGVALVLGRSALAMHALRKILARATPAGNAAQAALDDTRKTLGISRPIRFMLAGGLSGPAIVGFRRPWLIMSPETLARLAREELRHVCLHECAHVRRHDVALNYLVTTIAAAHWFNPAVWFMLSPLRAARELACDELALARTGDPRAYGKTLLKLFEATRPLSVPPAVGMVESRTSLAVRIRAIAAGPERSRWVALLPCLLLAALMTVTLNKPLPAAAAPPSTAPATPDPFIKKDAAGNSHYVPYAEVGEKLSRQMGCISCHSVDAALTIGTGPPWRTLYGRNHEFSITDPSSVVATGLKATDSEAKWDDYLRESMLKPDAAQVRYNGKNFHGMPSFSAQLSGSTTAIEMQRALATYIKSLGTKEFAHDIDPVRNPELFDADHPKFFDENKQPVHPESLAGIKARMASTAPPGVPADNIRERWSIQLQHIYAADVATYVRQFVQNESKRLSVSADAFGDTNTLVIVAPPELMKKIRAFVVQKDEDGAGASAPNAPANANDRRQRDADVQTAVAAALRASGEGRSAIDDDPTLRSLEAQRISLVQDKVVEENKLSPSLQKISDLNSRLKVVADQTQEQRERLEALHHVTTQFYDVRDLLDISAADNRAHVPLTADQQSRMDQLVDALSRLAIADESVSAYDGMILVAATDEGHARVREILAGLRARTMPQIKPNDPRLGPNYPANTHPDAPSAFEQFSPDSHF